ncbi:MAG: Trk system potassium transporter TrkA [Planctomycetota bacterium]
MRIVIVGGGVVGQHLAEFLSSEDHELTIVESDGAVAAQLSDRLDVFAIAGDGGSPRVLVEAGLREAEMVVAVTDSDYLNMFICLLAEGMGVKKKLARVRSEEFVRSPTLDLITRKFSIDRVINPELLVVDQIQHLLTTPGATAGFSLAGGKIWLHSFGVQPGVPLAGRQLKEVRELLPPEHPVLIVSLVRNAQQIVPRGEDRLQAGDRIQVVMAKDTLEPFLELVERRRSAVQRAFVFDGGRLGLAIARRVEQLVPNVVVFEPEAERAHEAALGVEYALVVRGSPTELDLLHEHDVETCDMFVAASEDEEQNVMSALQARRRGARRVIVVTSKRENVQLLSTTGVDVVIEPKMLTVSELITEVRGARVLSVARVGEDAELMELLATPGSGAVGQPLREVDIPRGMLVGLIMRATADGGESVEVPTGESVIQPGDKVIVFTLPRLRQQAERLVCAGQRA